jgi:glycosyltransferase involved in cell wall biosynthesis
VTRATKITVGIPTFNRSLWLRESVESVLAQTLTDFRLVISDNASEDDTAEVVRSFGDPRIDYLRSDTNIGPTANINKLIGLADTEYLVLLPDDDLLYPDHLRSVFELMERFGSAGLAHSAFDVIDADSKLVERIHPVKSHSTMSFEKREHALERLFRSSWPMCFSTVMYRTDAIAAVGGFVSEAAFSGRRLWMDIALNWDFAYVDRPLAGLRVHEETLTTTYANQRENGFDERERKLMDAKTLFELRSTFLDGAPLNPEVAKWLRSITTVKLYAEEGDAAQPYREALGSVLKVALKSPRIVLKREFWQVVLRADAIRLSMLRLRAKITQSVKVWARASR